MRNRIACVLFLFSFVFLEGCFVFFRNPAFDFLIFNFDDQDYKLHYNLGKDVPKIVPKNSFLWGKFRLNMDNEPVLEETSFYRDIIGAAYRQIPAEKERHIFLPAARFSSTEKQFLREKRGENNDGWIKTRCAILDYGYGSGFGFWKGLFFIEDGLLYAVPIALVFEDYGIVVAEFRFWGYIDAGKEERLKKIIELNKEFLKNNQPVLKLFPRDEKSRAFPLPLQISDFDLNYPK
ncbi:MAG: hypothetical protein LBD14_03265 [Puniceicoccales bacterium]|jgi:hypothetical protein|nr:hypothetical protein [Puniceicoccales bacterium]